MRGIVQIAGVRDADEARRLCDLGVDWLGFPFRLDHHGEDLSEEEAREIIADLPASVTPVLITYLTEAEEILELSRFLGTRLVQLHGRVEADLGRQLRRASPELGLIRSLIVKPGGVAELEEALRAWTPWADYFLTDSYDPETGASGATGKVHDWETSRELVRKAKKPLILAGGLNPDNVAEAIRQVHPAGVDSHTGVENKLGAKEASKVEAFLTAARQAFALLSLREQGPRGFDRKVGPS